MREVRYSISNINRRIEAVFTRDDRQEEKLNNHQKRIEKLKKPLLLRLLSNPQTLGAKFPLTFFPV